MLLLTGFRVEGNEIVEQFYSKIEILENGSVRLVKTDEKPDIKIEFN